MITADILGLIAGALTTISFLPQVIRSFKTRSTKDISFVMILLLDSGILLWIIYGIMTGALPVIAANSASFVLVSILIILKFMHK